MQNLFLGSVMTVFSIKTLIAGMAEVTREKEETGCGDIVSGIVKAYHGIFGLILAMPIFFGLFHNVYAFMPVALYAVSLYFFGQKVTVNRKASRKVKKEKRRSSERD
ncbi:hypothetical protein [Oribacterium sp. FC2011]|uniref:hypothetical protein n=1 Tax=Oribacterium sp. FC2011 TaxID=1408311 RepID=UPI0004E27207|nr:hypothetical protein [Oribacterium sp. FC2011]